MPRVSLLGKKSKYDAKTSEYEEVIFGRLATKKITHETLAKHLGKTRSAVSYSLHDIDRLRLGDLRVIADVAGLEIIIRKKE